MAIIEIDIQRDLSTEKTDEEWRDQANCKGDTRLFFPPKAERPQARARREAKAQRLCDSCPVGEPCREFARDNLQRVEMRRRAKAGGRAGQ